MNLKYSSLLPVAAVSLMVAACSEDTPNQTPIANLSSSSAMDVPLPVMSSSSPAIDSVIETPVGVGVLLDDFEDGDGISSIDTYWYGYDDNPAPNKGASVISVIRNDYDNFVPSLADNGSKYMLVVNYSLNKGEYAHDPYVGWGFEVDQDPANARFGGITYWYKGGAHEVHVELSTVKDYDVHLMKMKASRTWTKAVVRFQDMAQGGWGKEVEFDATKIRAISFQAKGDGVVDSLYMDNIYLQDTSEVEKDKPDMTLSPAVIPTVLFTQDEITVTNPLQEKAMKYLDKGVSFTNWLENEDGKFKSFEIGEADVKLLADNGVKSVRLPIDLDLYATNRDKFVAATSPDSVVALEFDDVALFTVLDSFVAWTERYGVSLVIDYHEYDNSYNKTSADNPRYVQMMSEVWKHVAEHYAANPREDIFYELLNEPDMSKGLVTQAQWTVAAQSIIDSIRAVDKVHTLLFGDVKWYSITLLANRTPFADDNVIYVIHTYEPFAFTHQGASWTDYGCIKNLMFPYDPAGWSEYSAYFGVNKSTVPYVKQNILNYYKTGSKEAILEAVLVAKKWAAKNNVPVIINEFGALNLRSTAESRLNYLRAMREIGDTLQIPLTHWGYTGNFSVIENGKLIEGVGEALGFIEGAPADVIPAVTPADGTPVVSNPTDVVPAVSNPTETPADGSTVPNVPAEGAL